METFIIPDELEERDVNQWVGNTWVLYEGQPHVVETVVSARELSCRPLELGDTDLGAALGPFVTVPRSRADGWWPALGAVNVPLAQGPVVAAYVERAPSRQWRRSFGPDLVRVYFPGVDSCSLLENMRPWNGSYGERCRGLLTTALVAALFREEYIPASRALDLLGRKRPSVAISPSVSLVFQSADTARVYYRRQPMGSVVRATGEFIAQRSSPIVKSITRLLGEK